jgi:Flp pilus assembly protein TadG
MGHLARQRSVGDKRKNRAQARRRSWSSQSGQSLLEVALMLPFVLLLLLGVTEIGRYAYIGILIGNSARAGASYGAQGLVQSVDTVGISNAADNDFKNNGQNVANLAITSGVACGCDSSGTVAAQACTGTTAGTCAAGHWTVILTVTASGTFTSLFNYPGIPPSVSISRSSTIRVNLYG